MNKNDIAIIGFSARFPDAPDYMQFYKNLKEGKDSVKTLSEDRMKRAGLSGKEYQAGGYMENIDLFDHDFFNISFGEAINMAPEQRILMEVVYEAIEDSGYNSESYSGSRTSLYVSDTDLDYYKLAKEFDPTLYTGNINAVIAGRVSRFFNLRGAAVMVDTACSSSLVAVHMACNDLVTANADYAIACGCKLALFPLEKEDVIDIGISSRSGKARAFSDDADGTIGGEGFGCVILKPLEKAIADGDNIHAVIKGTAANQDGKLSGSLTAPDSVAQSEVLKESWRKAGISPAEISYIEAHGTGTKLGDPIEVAGINIAFEKFTDRKNFCAISSVKTNIGHSDSAAGMASLIKTILALKHKELFPSLHFTSPNALINFNESAVYVNDHLKKWESSEPRLAGVSSFGLIGTNCHVVLQEAPEIKNVEQNKLLSRLITITAKTAEALEANINALAEHLQSNEKDSLKNISYTLTAGRQQYNHRFAVTTTNKKELQEALTEKKVENYSRVLNDNIKTFFVFSRDAKITEVQLNKLCNVSPEFNNYYNECLQAPGFDKSHEGCKLFAFQYAFFNTIQEHGISCPYLIGDNEGKLSIAAIKKEMSLEQAIHELLQFEIQKTSPVSARIDALLEKEAKGQAVLFVEAGPSGNISNALKEKAKTNFSVKVIVLENESDDLLLSFIKQLYLHGNKISWTKFWKKENATRISLPAYKFKRTSCWLDTTSKTEKTNTENEKIRKSLFSLRWVELPSVEVTQPLSNKTILIFSDNEGLADALILELRSSNNRCIKVYFAEHYKKDSDDLYAINILAEKEYATLFSELEKNNTLPNHIIHTGNYKNNNFFSGNAQDRFAGVYSQFFLIKVFSSLFEKKKTSIAFITSDAYKISASDLAPDPVSAMSGAMLNALMAENRKMNVCSIDINYDDPGKELAEILASELAAENSIRFCAYRNGRRYVKKLNALEIEEPGTQSPVLKKDGVYLISGGSKGIGYEICRYIVTKVKCRLIIIGKSEMTTALQSKLDQLKKEGSEVDYYSANVSDKKQLADVFTSIAKNGNRLDGIIHSAGISGNRTLSAEMPFEDFQETLAPKVKGTIYLDELSRRFDPGFFIMFSSLNTYIAQKATIDYTAANAFMDAYPAYKNSGSKKYLTINWPGWKETGMSASNTSEEGLALKPLSNADGIYAFHLTLNSTATDVAVIDADLQSIAENPYFLVNDEQQSKELGAERTVVNPYNEGGTLKEKLKAIWYSVLKTEHIGDDDDFFDLGGHSLNGSQIMNKIRTEFGVEIEFDHLLDYSTVDTLSAYLETVAPQGQPQTTVEIKPAPLQPDYELSHSQKRFWILNSISDPAVYNTPTVYRITGKINIAAWNSALQSLVERHESLRTVYITVNGEPRQKIISPAAAEFKLSCVDIPEDSKTELKISELINAEIRKPFDIEKDLLIRAGLFRIEEQEHIFIINLHHIVTDGVSTDIIVHDFLAFYQSYVNEAPHQLAPLIIQYKDYALWQNALLKNEGLLHQQYWLEQFKDKIPVLEMPVVLERPAVKTFKGKMVNAELELELSADIRKLSKENDVTLFMTFMAAFKALLYCYSGQTDIVIGTPIAGRESSMLENQVGLYINFLPLRTRFNEDENLKQLLQNFKRIALGGFEHQVYPFDKLVEDLNLKLVEGHNYLYDIGFTFHMDNEDPLKKNNLLSDLKIDEVEIESGYVKTDIWMNVLDRGDSLELGVEYNTDIYKQEFIEDFISHYKYILSVMKVGNEPLGKLKSDIADREATLKKIRYEKLKEKKQQSWNTFKK